jgi:hypothetical protein
VSDSLVNWWVILDTEAERRWRDTLGQADIDAWCAAHGWDAKDVLSESVMVSGLADGRVEVVADLIQRDDDGKPIWHNGGPLRRMNYAPYSRPLPEGIAPVRRP